MWGFHRDVIPSKSFPCVTSEGWTGSQRSVSKCFQNQTAGIVVVAQVISDFKNTEIGFQRDLQKPTYENSLRVFLMDEGISRM